ncbi:MAG: glycine cleavage system aminomethyltransferase GcvT [Candidatus Bathyarchaeota archaeon]|nr:MAG: glycine cleavage system aminomethyltransferase GcvT [Candidatus Bathyarchaeota archaeon]
MDLRKTHLYDYHAEHGNIVDFGGFALPVWFEGIISEHNAVRNDVGVFDTSHMGRSMAEGPDTEKFLNWIITNDVSKLGLMGGLYTVILTPDAGIIDDLITYKLGPEKYFIVYNAGTREKDFAWFKENAEGFDVEITDLSDDMAMMAVQGPRAAEVVDEITEEDVAGVERFNIAEVTIGGLPCLVTRTGYTGEDGFEVYVKDCPLRSPGKALDVWNALVEAGAKPCGLGARDSLRLEAGLNLSGQDVNEGTNPLEAKLRWVVKFKKEGGFIGKEALQKAREAGVERTQIGIKMVSRGIPRHEYEIWDGEGKVKLGEVTSGGMAPSLGYGIGLGYVPKGYSKVGTPLKVKIRGRLADVEVVKSHPFYDDKVYGWKRDR